MKAKKGMIASSMVAVSAVLGGLSGAMARNLALDPGEYALTMTYQVQNETQNESRTATRCIRPQDLENPESIFNDYTGAAHEKEEACWVKNLKNADGKVSYDAECSNRMVHVEGSMSGTRFAVVRTVKPKAGAGVALKFTVRATRVGDCLTPGTN